MFRDRQPQYVKTKKRDTVLWVTILVGTWGFAQGKIKGVLIPTVKDFKNPLPNIWRLWMEKMYDHNQEIKLGLEAFCSQCGAVGVGMTKDLRLGTQEELINVFLCKQKAKSILMSSPQVIFSPHFFLFFFTLSSFKNLFIYLFYFTTLIFCNHQEYLTNRVSYSVIKTFGNFYSKKLEIAFLLIFIHSKTFRLYRTWLREKQNHP